MFDSKILHQTPTHAFPAHLLFFSFFSSLSPAACVLRRMMCHSGSNRVPKSLSELVHHLNEPTVGDRNMSDFFSVHFLSHSCHAAAAAAAAVGESASIARSLLHSRSLAIACTHACLCLALPPAFACQSYLSFLSFPLFLAVSLLHANANPAFTILPICSRERTTDATRRPETKHEKTNKLTPGTRLLSSACVRVRVSLCVGVHLLRVNPCSSRDSSHSAVTFRWRERIDPLSISCDFPRFTCLLS